MNNTQNSSFEVLFVSHKYPPATGGMEKQCFELIAGMQAHTRVHALVLAENENRLWFFWRLEVRINQILSANSKIKIIHFNDALIGAVALRHQSYLHIKRVVTVHGLDVVFPNKRFQHDILPKFNQFDQIIAVSRATREACLERGLDTKRVVVIPNGVSHEIADMQPAFTKSELAKKYGFDAQKPVLIAMGRPVKRKGFSWLVEKVMPLVHERGQLIIIGPFETRMTFLELLMSFLPKKIQNQVELMFGMPTDQPALRQALSVQMRTRHLGRLPFADLVSLLKSADLFLMPNLSVYGDMEGFGLVCLEAALAPAHVLAAEIDGITDAIQDQKNGVLLPSGDAAVWATAINDRLDNPTTCRAQAIDYQTFTIANYSWKRMVAGYFTVND
jgi:glycosyltransferase involved in cell wall biosynthesis